MNYLLKKYDLYVRRNQTRRELQSLTNKELADIGINRSNIEEIVRETR